MAWQNRKSTGQNPQSWEKGVGETFCENISQIARNQRFDFLDAENLHLLVFAVLTGTAGRKEIYRDSQLGHLRK